MDAYADDLGAVIEWLDLTDVVLVGAVPPVMLKSDASPDGLTIDLFDANRAGRRDCTKSPSAL